MSATRTMARPMTFSNTADRLGHIGQPAQDDSHTTAGSRLNFSNSGTWTLDTWNRAVGSATRDNSATRTDNMALLTQRDTSRSNGVSASAIINSKTFDRLEPSFAAGQTLETPATLSKGSDLLNGSQPLYAHSSQRQFEPVNTNAKPRSGNGELSDGGHFSRLSTDNVYSFPSFGPYPDTASVQSPTDERQSISTSENFFAASGHPSRNSSLPPSRHGNDAFPTQVIDSPFGRYGGHTQSISSMSGSQYHSERHGSIHSQHSAQLGSGTASKQHIAPLSHSNRLPETNGEDWIDENILQAFQDQLALSSNGQFNNMGHFAGLGGTMPAFGTPNIQASFTPGGNSARPFLSASGSPGLDSTYGRRTNGSRHNGAAHPAALERRLQGLQQQQINSPMTHAPYPSSPMNPLRGFYSSQGIPPAHYQYAGLPLNPLSLTPFVPYFQGPPTKQPASREQDQSMQSQILSDFKISQKPSSHSTRQWQLKDIQGVVVEFCGDQVGSRWIQAKLETANSDEKQQLFSEILPDATQLMKDVFGNYVVQKFIDHGDQIQKGKLAAAMKGSLVELSCQMYACRVVQKAIDHVLTSQQASMILELEPHVMKCVKDMNGNHVIQKIIQTVPAEHIQFIVDTFTGKVQELSTHSFGCRVIQRVLEYCSDPVKHTILTELHGCTETLITDPYGNYVVQHMIEHGYIEDRNKVIQLVESNLMANSKHKFASNVVEKCFIFGTSAQKKEMLKKLLESSNGQDTGLMQLVKDPFGNYVIQKVLETLKDGDFDDFVAQLHPEVQKAKLTMSGKHLNAVEKKMRRPEHQERVHNHVAEATVGASPSAPQQYTPQYKAPPTGPHFRHGGIHRAPIPLNPQAAPRGPPFNGQR